MWQMNDAFMAAKTAAANVPGDGEVGSYTAAMFQEDFPQFLDAEKNSLVPEKILDQFISQANDSVLPYRWGSMDFTRRTSRHCICRPMLRHLHRRRRQQQERSRPAQSSRRRWGTPPSVMITAPSLLGLRSGEHGTQHSMDSSLSRWRD